MQKLEKLRGSGQPCGLEIVFSYQQVITRLFTPNFKHKENCNIKFIIGHLHQVRSYGRSLSYTTLFTPMKMFNGTGCVNKTEEDTTETDDKETSVEFTPFSELYSVWKLNDEV